MDSKLNLLDESINEDLTNLFNNNHTATSNQILTIHESLDNAKAQIQSTHCISAQNDATIVYCLKTLCQHLKCVEEETKPHPNKGRKHSPEAREKIRKASLKRQKEAKAIKRKEKRSEWSALKRGQLSLADLGGDKTQKGADTFL